MSAWPFCCEQVRAGSYGSEGWGFESLRARLTFSQADTLVFIVLLVFILAQIVVWPHFDRIVRDNEILMGWYAANNGSIRSKGTLYFVLHPHGLNMSGRWVGLGFDGRMMSGWASMGQTREESEKTMVGLIDSDGVAYVHD